ncbi:hypothetical protein CFP56_020987 [Quercus suber]|uniref:Uncharacterized protein n=1 Tax=Quercus suber TaxID=58331 RepID=A0AAW0M036_QUESU
MGAPKVSLETRGKRKQSLGHKKIPATFDFIFILLINTNTADGERNRDKKKKEKITRVSLGGLF